MLTIQEILEKRIALERQLTYAEEERNHENSQGFTGASKGMPA